jgi:protease PrsW
MTIDQNHPSAVVRHRSAWGYLAAGGILIAGVVAYLAVLFVMIDTQNVNFFPALLFVGAITVPMSVLVFVYQAAPLARVPAWAIVFTAIVGGLIGVLAAGLLEYDALQRLGSLPMVLVGAIEEAAKLIVPVILYLLWRPNNPRGGITIGIASGMGFATLETMGYGFQALLAGGIAAVDDTLLLRGLTGMTVAMLWRIRTADHLTSADTGRRPIGAQEASRPLKLSQ